MSLQGTSDFISQLLQGNEEQRSQLLGQTNQLSAFVKLLQELTTGQYSLSHEEAQIELEQFPGIHELLSHPQNLKQVALGFSQLNMYFYQANDSKISKEEIHYNIDLLRICNVILCFLNSKVKIDDDIAAILKLGLIENYVRLGKTCFQFSSIELDPEYFEAHLAFNDAKLYYDQALSIYQECNPVFTDFYSKSSTDPLMSKAQVHFRKYALRFIQSKMQANEGSCLIANRKREFEEFQVHFKELHQTINFAIAKMSFYTTPEKSAKELTTQFMTPFLHLSQISAAGQKRPDNSVEIFVKSLYQTIVQYNATFGIADCKPIEPKALSVDFLIERAQRFISQTENIAPQHFTILFSDDIQHAITAYHQEDSQLQLGMVTMMRYWFRYILDCRGVSQTAYDTLALESLYQIRMSLFNVLEKKYAASYIETATMNLENYQNACTIAKSSTEDIVKWIEGPQKPKKKKVAKKMAATTTPNHHQRQDNSQATTSSQATVTIDKASESDNCSQTKPVLPVKKTKEITKVVTNDSKVQISTPELKKTKAVTQPSKSENKSHNGPIKPTKKERTATTVKSASKPQPKPLPPKTTDKPVVKSKGQSNSLPTTQKAQPLNTKENKVLTATVSSSSPVKSQTAELPKKVTILINTAREKPPTSYAAAVTSSESSTKVSPSPSTTGFSSSPKTVTVSAEIPKKVTVLKNPAREKISSNSAYVASSSKPVTVPVTLDTSNDIKALTCAIDSLTIHKELEPLIDSRIGYYLKSIPPKVGHAMSLIKAKNKNVFIYGGYIRDTLNGKRWHDVDLVSDCDEQTLLTLFPWATKNPLITDYPVYTIGHKTTITLVKQCDLKIFSKSRFLATDALFADITGQIWDPMNVFHLLHAPILMAMPGINIIESFKEDPSRLLKTIRTSTHLQRNWERKIYDAITTTSSQLKKLPFSKFLFQFSELFLRDSAVLHLYICYHTGIIPEIALPLGSDWQKYFSDQSFSFNFMKLCLAQIDHYPLKKISHQNRLYLLAIFLLPALEKNRLLEYAGDWVYTNQAIDESVTTLLEQYFSLYEGEMDADAQRANFHQLKSILTQGLWPCFLANRMRTLESLQAFYYQPPPNAFYAPIQTPSSYAVHDGYATYAPYYAIQATPSLIPNTQPCYEPPVYGCTPK
ncbi:hypothetical protein [Candidatus Berkiella aquae]|uniref:Poly(A) polymerase I n=1 Tax=Candidatus Berkiella aquae TaxID=295108 RepID=A0A0Q9YNN3_9GAMM|nr:hypothetical protein [Candidatus Berkiella aquae]MCS5711023.1 hypothetical protein [Candidatus Berkiella aquae]